MHYIIALILALVLLWVSVLKILNNRWGEFVITPALMMGMDDIILDCIEFGGVKELEEIYSQ